MERKDIENGIKSYRYRLEKRKKDAIDAVLEESYLAAQAALSDCVAYREVIGELNFQLACMEEDDDQD